jgi:cobalamin biosynthesis protein CobW
MTEPIVGVTIVSGFLGSGKTTLLRRLVADPDLGPRIAVIVNDVGELGLDPELVRSAGTTPTLAVTELVSGCICCTLQGELTTALRSLVRGDGLGRRPEHIFIEPSGIARASELSFAVNALGFDEPLRTDAVVTLVDAWNARRTATEQPELFEDQLRSADLVLINKRDLLASAADERALLDWLRPLAARATILSCQRATVSLPLLLGRLALSSPTASLFAAKPPHQHAGHDIAAQTLAVPFVLDRAGLEDFLEAAGERIFRIKGIVDVAWQAGQGSQPTLVQAVGDRVELDLVPADSPLHAAERRLIFIGDPAALDRLALAAELSRMAIAAPAR